VRDFDRAIVEEFRANGGRVGGVLAGTPLMLVHHIGARSGVAHVTPLACTVRGPGEYLIVASNGGSRTHPAWYHNLKAHPVVTVELGAETFAATATELEGAERAAVWPGLLAASPSLRDFAARAGREIPVFALESGAR
jgi:deazaflavin-dependent oxidoreductase (nitroreductase family)